MKTVLINQPGEIQVADTPMPEVKEGEALLKIRYCGICGADVASYTGNQPFTTYPRIPGHEFSAEIVTVPENKLGLKPGDVVTANPYFNCGHCYSCERGFVNCCTDNQTMGVQRDGSFCEYVAMPIERIIPGMGLDAKTLALIEPFSISWHALSRAKVEPTDKVLVVGAGPIGLFAMISAKLRGAQVYVSDMMQGRLDAALEYGEDGVINGVRRLLYEVVYNLCDNSIKYNNPGGYVKVSVSEQQGAVQISVSDNGIGIAPEHQDKVFERFYRVDKSHSKQSGGTGLGLSIVKHAVQYHHGKITVESELNKGTTISVLFDTRA